MSHNVLMEGFAMGKVKKSAQRTPCSIAYLCMQLSMTGTTKRAQRPERGSGIPDAGRDLERKAPDDPERRCSAGMRPVRVFA